MKNRKKAQQKRRNIGIALFLLTVTGLALLLWGCTRRQPPSSQNPASSPSSQTAAQSTTGKTVPTATQPTATQPTATQPPATQPPTAGKQHYVQPAGAPWHLRLVNDWNALPATFESTMTLANVTNASKQMDSRAVDALKDMLEAGAAQRLTPVSLFRSRAQQEGLYNKEVRRWQNKGNDLTTAKAKAATVVKRPGESEHNTGLAADLGGNGNNSLNEDFENTAAFRWLQENCASFGFILRFPKDKQAITGVIYEPWHYRYVGKEAAQEIMSRGLCLEEYLQEKGM